MLTDKFRRNYSNKRKFSFFYNLFLSISLILAVLLIISAVAANTLYSTHLRESIYESDLSVLSQINKNYIMINELMQSFLLRISNDDIATQLMFSSSSNYDAREILSQMEVMNSYRSNTVFVDSFYLYREDTSAYYCIGESSVIRTENDMFDSEIVGIINGLSADNKNIILIPREIPVSPYTTTLSKKVYTYILPRFNYSTGALEYVYVVNVDASWLMDSVITEKSDAEGETTQLIVLNEDNIILAHTEKELFGTKFPDEDYLLQIRESDAATGSFEITIDDEEYFLSYINNAKKDILLFNITYKNQLFGRINLINKLTIVIVTVMFLVSILVSYFASKILYNPISELKSNLQNLFFSNAGEASGSRNEFVIMKESFENIHSQYKNLESFKKGNLDNLRHSILFEVLFNKSFSEKAFSEKCREYNFKVDTSKNMQLLGFTIDNYPEFIARQNYIDIGNTLYNIVNDNLSNIFKCEVIHVNNNYYAIINTHTAKAAKSNIAEVAKNIQKAAREETEFTLSAALSTDIKDVDELKQAFEELQELQAHRFIKGYESIITIGILLETDDEDFSIPYSKVKKLTELIKSEKEDACIEMADSIFNYLSGFSLNDIKLGLTYLSVELMDTFNISAENNQIDFNLDFMEFSDSINKMETLGQVKKEYESVINDYIEKVKESRKNKSFELIEHVKEYITTNYKDCNLTPNLIARRNALTLKYLNSLFKRSTGISMAAYINEYRLEKSAEELINTSKSIDSILDDIGWDNRAYFYTLFKNRHGCSPNSYRKNHMPD